jgi:site-specific recombinase XerD
MNTTETKHSVEQLSKEMLADMVSAGYSPGTLDNWRRTLSRVERFMGAETAYSEQSGQDFVDCSTEKLGEASSQRRYVRTVIRRLDELNFGTDACNNQPGTSHTVPEPYRELLESYLSLCIKQGNKPSTINTKRRFCASFFTGLNNSGCTSIADINAVSIGQAVLGLRNKDAYAVARQLLKHLFEVEVIKNDYSGIIPQYRRRIVLPTTYSTDEIRRLETSVDKASRTGNRDYAVLLLATRLGMRAGDIATLTFGNIDFENDSINFVQGKTGQPLTLPLLPEIRAAIIEYIRNSRPKVDSDFLFIRANAPHRAITTSVLRYSLSKYFKVANIDISDKKHGPHSLRSSLASSMVNDDMPYEVVRKLLGHSDPDAIKHYAKVDIEKLRCYAIDVPGPSGRFANLLEGRI